MSLAEKKDLLGNLNKTEIELEKLIYSSGHYKKKARTLKHVSNEILKKFNGKVPNKKEELLSIKKNTIES